MARRHLSWFTYLDAPAAEAIRLFDADPSVWLPAAAEACHDGWRVQLDATGALPAALGRRDAIVRVGPTSAGADGARRGLTWRAVTLDRLFPVLDADLELVKLHGGGCQLTLMGTYRPPLSVVGGIAEGLLGHRVAEACVRRFVLDIADRLTAAMPAAARQRA